MSEAPRPEYLLMARRCDQCLMGKNKIVSDARRRQILADTEADNCAFLCHKGSLADQRIACRGHHDATGGGLAARLAGAFGFVVEIDPDTLERAKKS